MRAGRCFFTGHRIISNHDREILLERIKELVLDMEKDGVYEFYAGGALGFDYVAATAVIEAKKLRPNLYLRLFLPCYGSEKKWTAVEKYNFNMLKTKCDSFEYITEEKYSSGCMQKRNIAMADLCGVCVAFCKTDRSGTKKTMEYAESVGCRIINLADEFILDC